MTCPTISHPLLRDADDTKLYSEVVSAYVKLACTITLQVIVTSDLKWLSHIKMAKP